MPSRRRQRKFDKEIIGRRCSPSTPSRRRRAAPSGACRPACGGRSSQGAAVSSSSRVQRSPMPLARLPCAWVCALTRPGWISLRSAETTVASSGRGKAGRADLARSCRRGSGCRPARPCPCRCRAPGRRGLSCGPSDRLPWQPIRHSTAFPKRVLRHALRLRLGAAQDEGHWLMASTEFPHPERERSEQSKDAQSLSSSVSRETPIPVPGLRGHPRRESVEAKMWAAGTSPATGNLVFRGSAQFAAKQ